MLARAWSFALRGSELHVVPGSARQRRYDPQGGPVRVLARPSCAECTGRDAAPRPAKKASEVEGREIFRLTEQTTFLLTTCLLFDLGFDELAAVEATRRSRRFRILTELFGRS
jgi:hypothetical protein